jgi:hypothetical protein
MTSPKSCVRLLATFVALVSLSQFHAQAGLVDGGGDLLNDLNNAIRFDPSTPTPAIVAFKDANLPLDRYIQVGFATTNSTAFNVTALAWSKDNVNYSTFTPNDFVNDIVAGGGMKLSNVIDLGSPIGGNSSTLFFLRYTLPTGISPGAVVQSTFYANSNGSTSQGVLSDQVDNHFISIARTHTAVPEPASLLLAFSATSLFGWKLRRTKSTRH